MVFLDGTYTLYSNSPFLTPALCLSIVTSFYFILTVSLSLIFMSRNTKDKGELVNKSQMEVKQL
jgi:hypothetical protein